MNKLLYTMIKRGQAAMEFIMTYGWAILAVLITIASLAYFGVLNFSLLTPNSCILFPGLACTDSLVDGNTKEIYLIVRNGFGQALDSISINITNCRGVSPKPGEPSNTIPGGIMIFGGSNCTNNIGSRIKSDLIVNYKLTDGIEHVRIGSLSSIVEPVSYQPIQILQDDFNDNQINRFLWRDYSSPDDKLPYSSSVLVEETNQELRITTPAWDTVPPCTAHYRGYVSLLRYNLYDNQLTFELDPISPGPASGDGTETEVYVASYLSGAGNPGSSSFYSVSISERWIKFIKLVNGNVYGDVTSTDYSSTNDHWFKIEHDSATNTVKFYTRPASGSWSLRQTYNHNPAISPLTCTAGTCQDSGFDITNLRVYMHGGMYRPSSCGSGSSPLMTRVFDNVNINAPP